MFSQKSRDNQKQVAQHFNVDEGSQGGCIDVGVVQSSDSKLKNSGVEGEFSPMTLNRQEHRSNMEAKDSSSAKSDRGPHRNSRYNTIQAIHQRAKAIVKRFKDCEVALIDVIQQADQNKVHYAMKYRSLFEYCSDGLGLSKEVAYIYIRLARKVSEVPALKEEIKQGRISVSKANRISSVLNVENQDYWLNLAKTETKQRLEKCVAAASPKQAVRERLDYVNASAEVKEHAKLIQLEHMSEEALKGLDQGETKTRVQLQVGVSEKLMLNLRRAQDLLSQKSKKPASLEKVLDEMTELYLERNDPVRKAERQKMRGKLQGAKLNSDPVAIDSRDDDSIRGSSVDTDDQIIGASGSQPFCKNINDSVNFTHDSGLNLPCPGTVSRRPLSASLKHQVQLEYQGRCGFIDKNGRRCTSTRFLEIHHIRPISKGGGNEFSNLTLLCSGHHKVIHTHEVVG